MSRGGRVVFVAGAYCEKGGRRGTPRRIPRTSIAANNPTMSGGVCGGAWSAAAPTSALRPRRRFICAKREFFLLRLILRSRCFCRRTPFPRHTIGKQ